MPKLPTTSTCAEFMADFTQNDSYLLFFHSWFFFFWFFKSFQKKTWCMRLGCVRVCIFFHLFFLKIKYYFSYSLMGTPNRSKFLPLQHIKVTMITNENTKKPDAGCLFFYFRTTIQLHAVVKDFVHRRQSRFR